MNTVIWLHEGGTVIAIVGELALTLPGVLTGSMLRVTARAERH